MNSRVWLVLLLALSGCGGPAYRSDSGNRLLFNKCDPDSRYVETSNGQEDWGCPVETDDGEVVDGESQ